jgi:hypothetical protein
MNKLLFATSGYEFEWMEEAAETFAWIGGQLEHPVFWTNDGDDKTSRAVFDAYLRQQAEAFDAVEPFPHWPEFPRHFYHYPEVEGGDGKAFDGLLDFYNPATTIDRSLIMANYITTLWGGPFGCRPAFLYEAAVGQEQGGRGVGKSAAAMGPGILLDGSIQVDPLADFKQIRTDLLSPSALTRRVALLDNVKKHKFSWAELESIITIDQIGGHRMYTGFASRPNTLTWIITLNNATLSKDLAQRCVIIRLNRSRYGSTWVGRVQAYIARHRWAIIGDILARLKAEKPTLVNFSRWGPWEQEVLACVPNPAACQKVIAMRQAEVDGDQEEADLIREAFADAIRRYLFDPDTAVLFIPSTDAADIYNLATRSSFSPQQVTRHLQMLAIPELRKYKLDGKRRGFRWVGLKADLKARTGRPKDFVFDHDKFAELFPNRGRAGRPSSPPMP